MKKRKLLSVMLCIMLLVMGICACGKSEVQKDSSDSSSGDDEKIELTFMGWQPELQIMNEKMLPLLEEKYPNIHIKVEVLEWFDYWDKLTIDSVAGDSADIVAMDVDHIPTF